MISPANFNFRSLVQFLLLWTTVASCQSDGNYPKAQTIQIPGRENAEFYQITVPLNWVVQNHSSDAFKHDSKISLVEFTIPDDSDHIRISIHNFPNNHLNSRIPPFQQIERWKKQFSSLESQSILPQSFSGYVGLLFEGQGSMNQKKMSMLAWTMQLDTSLYQYLDKLQTYDKTSLYKEMQADFTIKALGSTEVLQKYQKQIIEAAHSFKIKYEIPYSL